MAPEQFGPYRLEELVGRGGMGEVYRAYDTTKLRYVALKRLPRDRAADPQFVARFRKEAALAARLTAPHTIPIHDYGELDNQLYLTMTLVEADDLGSLLARDGRLEPMRAIHIVAQIAMALDAAHRQQLVHRDVKPSNALVTQDDFVYLIDFGIAKALEDTALTSTGAAVGSVDYMAPERFGDRPTDHRVDVYSLACVLFECLTGTRPFRRNSAPAVMHAHLSAPPPDVALHRPDLPPVLGSVVARGLAKDPAERYTSAGEFVAAARSAIEQDARSTATGHERPTATHPAFSSAPFHPPNTTSVPEVARRRRTGPIIAVGAVVLVAASPALVWLLLSSASDSLSVTKSDLEANVVSTLGKTVPGVGPVTCPGDLAGEVGMSITCETTTSDGQPIGATVTVTSVDGTTVNYDISTEARPVAKVLLETKVRELVEPQLGVPVDSLTCDGDLAASTGAIQTCRVAAGGEYLPLKISVSKIDGGLINFTVESA